MRILIATSNRNIVGGAETYLHALLPRLSARGHEIGILHEEPVNQERESIDQSGAGTIAWSVAELGLAVAAQSVERWKPDIVYSHGVNDAALEDTLLARYPTVLYAHNYYGTCVSGRKCYSLPHASPCGRRFGAACLFLYYPRRCGGLNPGTMWRMFQRQNSLNSQLRRFQAILVASRHMYGEFQQHEVSPDKLHLVPLPATDILPMATAPSRRTPTGQILFIGRLTDLKGVDHLIRAIARIGRNLRLTVAGDGPERKRLEDLARQSGVQVKFSGWVQKQQKMDLIQQADLLAVPSLWPEPFGLVGIEAACLGLPSVGYAVGGIPDWLIPGQTGELAPADPPSVDGLAEAIQRALGDENHYSHLCRGAWEYSKRFSIEAHLDKLEAILTAAADTVLPQGLLVH